MRQEFVFKKWSYGFKSLEGYITSRKIMDLEGFDKYKVGETINKIPIYEWNFEMWFKWYLNERRQHRKSNFNMDRD